MLQDARSTFDQDHAELLVEGRGPFSATGFAAAGNALRVAMIGNYAPHRCGIATYTVDTCASFGLTYPSVIFDVYAMKPRTSGMVFATPVRAAITAGDGKSFEAAAAEINRSGADIVWLQHEFGLFGGIAGDCILSLVEAIAAPLVITLHTILAHPDDDQMRVMKALIARASQLIVMSQSGRRTLKSVYDVDDSQIAVIAHGAPDRPFGRSAQFKEKFGFAGRKIIMTFGLLSPGKGIEAVIGALPQIVESHPDALYCIVGATHPNLIDREGERYRDTLKNQIAALGVDNHVAWVDEFLENEELLDYIEAADIYVTPYPGADQSTSGTLSYAFALGKAVVSTPYVHAVELLSDDHGILVPFNDSAAIGHEINALFENPARLLAIQQRAYVRGRSTIWPMIAAQSMEKIGCHIVNRPEQNTKANYVRHRPKLSFDAVLNLSDGTGILQHSTYAVADRNHGYCIDDNARALILANKLGSKHHAAIDGLATTYAAFVNHAWNPDLQCFRNFMGYNRMWLEDEGSEDSNGRTIWAIGQTFNEANNEGLRHWARAMFDKVAPCALKFESPRALAFAALGADHVLAVNPDHMIARQIANEAGDRLAALLNAERRPDWAWFEVVLAYDNCRLPEALLRVGMRLNRDDLVSCGLETLSWIIARQTASEGHFRPVGSDSFGRPHAQALPFDQQPLEAWAAIDAAQAAYAATHDLHWVDIAELAYAWFFGSNDRGAQLADVVSGVCHDGITARGVNENQGAESVLAVHLADCTIRALVDQIDQRAPKPQLVRSRGNVGTGSF